MSKTVWLIDIDGTICEDIPNEESDRFSSAFVFEGALEKVKELYERGDRVTFFTARKREHAATTEAWLDKHGFPYESVCYGKPRIKDGEVYHWVDNKAVLATFTPAGKSGPIFSVKS